MKEVLLGITSGGLNVPDWLLADYQIYKLHIYQIPTTPFDYGQPVTIPIFWDPIFWLRK